MKLKLSWWVAWSLSPACWGVGLSAQGVATWDQLPVRDLLATPQSSPELLTSSGFPRDGWPSEHDRRWTIAGEWNLISFDPDSKGLPTARGWLSQSALDAAVRSLAAAEGDVFHIEPLTAMLAVEPNSRAAIERSLAQLRSALPPVIRTNVRLDRIHGGKVTPLIGQTIELLPGHTALVSVTQQRRALVDYDVELAQAAVIANPIISTISDGALLAVRARAAAGVDLVVLECLARVGEPIGAPPIETDNPGFHRLDRAARRVRECAFVVACAAGKSVQQRLQDSEGNEYVLLLTPTWEPAPRGASTSEVEYDTFGAPLARFFGLLGDVNQRGADDWESAAFAARDAFDYQAAPAREGTNTCVAAVALNEKAALARRVTQATLSSGIKPTQLELRILDVPAGADVGETMPAGAALVGRCALAVLEGHGVVVAMREDRSILADWDAEVAQSARIPDPRIARLSVGLLLNLRVDPGEVVVDGMLSRLQDLQALTVPLARAMRTGASAANQVSSGEKQSSATASMSPDILLPEEHGRVELPQVAEVPLRATIRRSPEGRGEVRMAAPLLLGEGRELVLAIRVTE